MTRGLVLLSALVAMLAFALPASATDGRTLKGVLVSVSATSVAVKDAKGVVTTCARVAKSPSLDGFGAGDRVQAACVRTGSRLVLAKIRRLAGQTASVSNDVEPTKFGGVVTAVTDGSVTLRDGERTFTCSVGAASPSTADVHVGQHLKVSCSGGVLSSLTIITVPSGDAAKGQTGAGAISALSATSVTFHNAERTVTCARAATSPALGDYHVGDQVKFGCLNGTLIAIAKVVAPKPDGPHTTVGANGVVSAVSPSSLTVHTDGGNVTCAVGDGSPSVANVKVGDQVKMGCVDGVLKALARSEIPATGSGDAHPAVTVAGTLTALSSASLTVHGEHGDVTCTVPATARLGDFHVGDRVGMACVDGALLKLVKLT